MGLGSLSELAKILLVYFWENFMSQKNINIYSFMLTALKVFLPFFLSNDGFKSKDTS